MKRLLAVFFAVVLGSGCLGSFRLTKKVYDFNNGVGEKWVNEVVFLGLVIFPIYELATLADAIVFNSIEFWSGTNPVAKSPSGKNMQVVESGAYRAILSYNRDVDTIRMDSFKNYRLKDTLTFEKSADNVIAKSKTGDILYTSVTDELGGISIRDAQGKEFEYFTKTEVDQQLNKI